MRKGRLENLKQQGADGSSSPRSPGEDSELLGKFMDVLRQTANRPKEEVAEVSKTDDPEAVRNYSRRRRTR